MANADPGKQIDELHESERGGSDADRDRLLEMGDNIRLVPSGIGEHWHLKLLWHCTRISEGVDSVGFVDVLGDEDAARGVGYENHRDRDG